jgi:hypothetical protein
MATENVEKAGAPAWLFSFVDLAFLMLIAMTLVATDKAGAPDLGEMAVPRIGEEASKELAGGMASAVWQLRVHPPSQYDDGSLEPPFELLLGGANTPDVEPVTLDKDGLRQRLVALQGEGAGKPLLAPHEDSRSQDLLDAAGLIEQYWPSPRRALVSRLLDDR